MRIPIATYRLQINDDFTLHDARARVPYLARLGISDLYLSPVFEARSGSTHGYDVTDPTRVRESVGGIDALRALSAEARAHHMGILLDIVPNHMAASVENPWWRETLARGPESEWAVCFDVDWGTRDEPRRLRLPILGAALEDVIERGDLTIDRDTAELVCHGTRLPLAAGSLEPDPLDIRAVLSRQHYEPVFWRTAAEYMSYRRFFDITDLAAVRVEDEHVFRLTHELIRTLAADGIITGLRIDHVDGLRDPTGYLRQLRAFVRGPDGGPVYTVVEKILERGETIPPEWECEGTTGYEFLTLATGLLVEPSGHAELEQFHRRLGGDGRGFDELVREKKHLVMERLLGAELNALAARLHRITGTAEDACHGAIAELTANMRVYRTYTRDHAVRPEDRERIEEAYADASSRVSGPAHDALDRLRGVALLEAADVDPDECLEFVVRWQQFTGPVMAKGFEDTALYCHNALLAANDVGSDPLRPCLAARELHAALARRLVDAPHALNATATHDTKRGEDTRARIAVLSELSRDWRDRLRRWSREGAEWKTEPADDDEADVPSSDVESLLYQTLVGAWPIDGADDAFTARIKEYMTKAVREAKEQTSWRRPDEDYEQALADYIEQLMAEFGREGLAADIAAFAERIAPHGAINSIAQLLLKVTAPGIPDLYQGTELWSFTLVDPDNRRPVDYGVRDRLLEEVEPLRATPEPAAAQALLESWGDGRIKLYATAAALRFRAVHREVFEQGDVIELTAEGQAAEHVFAFARRHGERCTVTVLPRWSARLAAGRLPLGDVWGDTRLPLPPGLPHDWFDALTGRTWHGADALPLADLLAHLPFALLDLSQPIGA